MARVGGGAGEVSVAGVQASRPQPPARVVATAGHVDHGKSTLVLALTGVDPDRWPEEKSRGLTIDLGFAATTLPSGAEIAFVDVPGHDRYLRNMLAGVGAVAACLFVVSAAEGWAAQSEEHLRILELMGVRRGVVAVTKVAAADPEVKGRLFGELPRRLAGTFLEGGAVVPVDAPAGAGLDELRAALDELVRSLPPPVDDDRPRLWIDRAFVLRGAGTVVTGTLAGGGLRVGDELAVLPGREERIRVRAMQSHGAGLEVAGPGRRLAVNLTGVPHRLLGRGQALVRPGEWHPARTFDASLSVLASLDHPVTAKGAYVVHVGTGAFPVALRVIGGSAVEPGGEGAVRFWLQGPPGIPLTVGDRYVLREAGRAETQGGGEVRDVDPVLPLSRARPSGSVSDIVHDHGWVDVDRALALTGRRLPATVGRWVVDPKVLEEARVRIADACEAAGAAGLPLSSFDERERAVLHQGVAGVVVRNGRAAAAHLGAGLSAEAERQLAALTAARWSPPPADRSSIPALRELQRAGLAVEAGEAWFAAAAVDDAVAVLAGVLERQPDGFTVSQARDALGSTRRFVLPLLTHLDSAGVLRRRGDLRVAGPRLGRGGGGRESNPPLRDRRSQPL